MPTSVSIAAYEGDVVINEVQYDPVQNGFDAAFEWVELYNRTGLTLDLTDWRIADNNSDDCLTGLELPPGGFLVIAADAGFYDNFPEFNYDIAFIADGMIGNGLNNDGDRLSLMNSDGVVIDSLSYGDDSGLMSPPCRDVSAGHSLERQPAGLDTNRAADFVENGLPSPGGGLGFPTATPTSMPSLTPAYSPTPANTTVSGATPAPTAISVFIDTGNTTPVFTAAPTIAAPGNGSSGSPASTAAPSVFTTPTPSPVQDPISHDEAGNTPLYMGISLSLAVLGVIAIIVVYRVKRSR